MSMGGGGAMMPELRVEIDPMKLDEEWIGQPAQVHLWRDIASERQEELDRAKSSADLAKDALQQIKARLYLEMQSNPEDFNLEKATLPALENGVLIQPECQAALKKLRVAESRVIDAKRELGKALAAVEALVDRKRSLAYLSEFWFHDYYSEPNRASQEDKREVRQRGRRRREEVKEDRE